MIEGRINDEGRIAGNFTQQEVQDLSLTLRSGALPASLTYLEERTVGPSLGADSIRAGILASVVGLALVVLFMLGFYKLSGINAIVAMTVNLLVLMALMVYFHATMTLPGIAGFILTIGMGVDSNVLIFERIKEELLASKGVKTAIDAGFDRVFYTILDTHVASLIAAAFLFQFGTGPIRGFATTLSIGLLTNVFTSVFVSKTLFELVLGRSRATPAQHLGTERLLMQILHNTNYDFIRWRWHALISLVGDHHRRPDLRAGPRRRAPRHRLLGRHAGRAPVRPGGARGSGPQGARRGAGDKVVQKYGDDAAHQIMIRLPQVTDAEKGFSLERGRQGRHRRDPEGGLPHFKVIAPRWSARSSARTCSRRASTRRCSRSSGLTVYIALPVPLHLRGRRDHRDVPRHLHRVHDARVLQLRAVAEHRRRGADDHRLLGERHHRHLRPRPRERAAAAPRAARQGREPERQPDAGPDGHHVGRHVPVGRGAVSVRR